MNKNFFKIVFLLVLYISFIGINNANAQATCASADVISSLPYTATGLSTAGTVNDYTSPCGGLYMNGEDYVFSYTPSANQTVVVEATNLSTTWTGLFVLDACPDVATGCVATATNGTSLSTGNVSLTAGTTYYIVVSTWPTPDTVQFDISVTTVQTLDLKADVIINPKPIFCSDQPIGLQISNVGVDSVGSVTAGFTINGGTPVTSSFTLSPKLATGQSTTITFPSNAMFSAGTNNIVAFVTGDPNTSNDTVSKTVSKAPVQAINTFPFLENFSAPSPYFFSQANVDGIVKKIAWGADSAYGLYGRAGGFSGNNWQGSAVGTDSTQAWGVNESFWATLTSCQVDVSSLTNITLSFDLFQSSSFGSAYSWFRVLVNGVAIPDINGNYYHNQDYDPAINLKYDLSAYAGSSFELSFQGSGKYENNSGSDVSIIDNIQIYEPVNNDLSISGIAAPNAVSCSPSAVSFSVKNIGLLPVSSVSASYMFNGGTPVSESFTLSTPLAPNADTSFTFSTEANIPSGSNVLTVYLSGDQVAVNDTATKTVALSPILSINTFPFSEDFESGSTSYFSLDSAAQSGIKIVTNNGTKAVELTGGGAAGWVGGSTNADSVNAWVDNVSHHAAMRTCFVDASSVTSLNLKFDMWQTSSWGNVYSWFRVLVNGMPIADINGNVDFNADYASPVSLEYDLTAYAGTKFTLTFQASNKYDDAGSSQPQYDATYIDNIALTTAPAFDLQLMEIIKPVGGCFTTTDTLVVSVRNSGLSPVSSVDMQFAVVDGTNPATITSETFTLSPALAPGLIDTLTFTNLLTYQQAGNQGIVAWVNMADGDTSNDTLSKTVPNTVSYTAPYSSGFETSASLAGWTIVGTSNTWSVGTPNQTVVNGTFDGSARALVTRPDSNYADNVTAAVVSPCIDLSAISNPYLSFDLAFSIEQDWDGMILQYSTNGPTGPWIKVGATESGFYNNTSASGPVVPPKWSGVGAWQKYGIALPKLANVGTVSFRFLFISDVMGTDEGVAIDNFSVTQMVANDVAVTSILAPFSGCIGSAQEPVVFVVENKGSNTITTLEAKYSVGGNAPITQTFNGLSIPFNGKDTLAFTGIAGLDLSTTSVSNIALWTELPGDADLSNDTATKQVVVSAPWDPVANGSYAFGFERNVNAQNFEYALYNIENVNGDANTWAAIPTQGSFSAITGNWSGLYQFNSANAANDWIHTRCFSFDACSTYTIKFKYKAQSAIYPEKIALYLGTAPNSMAMTTKLFVDSMVTNTTPAEPVITFKVPASGIYNFGFHAFSDADNWWLTIDDIVVEKTTSQDTAVSLSAFVVDGCESPAHEVGVRLVNSGTTTLTSVPLTLSATGLVTGTVNETWTGSLAPGDSTVYTFGTTFNTTGGGTFTASAYASLQGFVPQCGDTLNVANINVIANPSAPTATNNGPVCVGDTLQLFSNTIAGASYSWSGPNSFTNTDEDPMLLGVTTAAAGKYYVSATVNGCNSPMDSTEVVINTAPAAPTGLTSNSPVCEGSDLTLMADAVTNGTFSWTGPNSFTNLNEDPTVTAATRMASGVYAVTVTVNGCTSLPSTLTAVIDTLPAAPMATSNSTCGSGTVDLSATGGPAGGSYNWYDVATGGTVLSTGATFTTPVITANTTYYVSAVSALAGCESATRSAATASVVSSIVPTVNIIGASTPLCVGDSVEFSAVVTGGGNAAAYEWFLNNTSVGTSPTLLVASPVNGDAVKVAVTSSESCASPNTVTDSTTINVNTPPAKPVVMVSGSDLTTATIAGGYVWFLNGITTVGLTQTITPAVNGMYSVVAVSDSGCVSDTSDMFAWPPTSIIDAQGIGVAVRIFPNPNNGTFQIEMDNLPGDRQAAITLLDATGRLVEKIELGKAQGSVNRWVNVKNHGQGLYFANVTVGSQRTVYKIIVQ